MQAEDFSRTYEAKSDEELIQIALDREELTLQARVALDIELSRRGIAAPAPRKIEGDTEVGQVISIAVHAQSPSKLIATTLELYKKHFLFFVTLAVPAVLLAYFVIRIGHNEARVIGQELLGNALYGEPLATNRTTAYLEILGINLASYLASWLLFCLLYAAISLAVAQIADGRSPSLGKCSDVFRRQPARLLGVSAVLYLLLIIAFAVKGFLSAAFLWVSASRILGTFPLVLTGMIGFGLSLILARFALAIPAVVLGGDGVRASLFRSDELTEGKWGHLAVLLVPSIIGGYVVWVLAYEVPAMIWDSVSNTFMQLMNGLFLAGLTLFEPVMLIGFSLMFLSESKSQIPPEFRFTTQAYVK